MKATITIAAPEVTRTIYKTYPPNTPEYVVADDAYVLALNLLDSHPDLSFAQLDYTWRLEE